MSFMYKGLEATYNRHMITDREVDQQMERLRQQTPKIVPITDRSAQRGDTVVLDYAGFCDGVQFEGGTAQGQKLVLGSNMFIPGFEDQLIGSQMGEDVTVHVTFPEKYHAPNLAGKAAEFRCTVHEIFEETTYELGDEFAKALGLRDFEHLKEDLRASLQYFSDERGEMDLQDRLIRKAAASLGYEPTAEEIEEALDEQMEALADQLRQQGLSMEMYCRFSNKTEAEIREDSRNDAVQILRVRVTIEKIAELEQITVTDEDMTRALENICRKNKITMEQLKSIYDEKFNESIARNLLMQKVMKFVRDSAVVSEEK